MTFRQEALRFASKADFPGFLTICDKAIAEHANDPDQLLDIGALLLHFGFLTKARQCFEQVRAIAPNDLRPVVNLANIAREAGEHAQASRLYQSLLKALPDNPVIRRNALVSQEYDPSVSDVQRLQAAKQWGEWAIGRAGGLRPRPTMQPLKNRPLRVGYVSADFCQHTVGLFVKDVLKRHDPQRITAFAYSAGQVDDWVTKQIRNVTQFRDVTKLDDQKLADLIRQDAIDVLVDLSGHTAGSRLTTFAHRPAPVMVSWLGYFATTGLSCMDAVLLDPWHAPQGMEQNFVERIIHLPNGRFCYQPVSFAPEVAPLPCLSKGYVTFDSFNNTAKYNPDVFRLWADILLFAPNSRLVLKWRTFHDDALRNSVLGFFEQQGVDPGRIELRGPSFHADMLAQYADIDIALDPFPFNGGLTSCEALWMGVPVVTWPQSRVVGRQTFAFLSAIGLSELAADTTEDYVRIAVDLANNHNRLNTLRTTMRERMKASPLMDLQGFTRQLEQTLIGLYREIQTKQ
ncbi:tetratricopeptide repeat protein [Desulfonatronum lacustre]|uniref:O-linked N-acetylglucosamine transferase, SPINDLY family protein n=1 Tax=Desulfonatronum lacustre TaxID=66849 RepID=UPI0004B05860|nr:tetratricopeptide repeat protein [Desulfonatronum lacustre]